MKIIAFVAVLAVAVAAAQASTLDAIIAREGPASGSFSAFQGFMSEFDRVYDTPSEMSRRFAIFQANMEDAAERNIEEPLAEYGITRFSDLTVEEFEAGFTMTFPDASNEPVNTEYIATPEEVAAANSRRLTNPAAGADWREKLNPIKDQKSCGSCWAFSAMAAIEGALVADADNLVDGSEQMLVDCDVPGSAGCRGGWMHTAIMTIAEQGVYSQASYPYEAKGPKECRTADAEKIAEISKLSVKCAHVKGVPKEIYTDKDCTDDETRAAIDNRVQSIAINANGIMSYRGGIADPKPKKCKPAGLNHGVDMVGYGSEDGVDYYIIRNSWGSRWGEKGHVRLIAGKNACGIDAYHVEAI